MSTPGWKTKIGYADDTDGPFVYFAGVREITPPTLESDDIDTSNMETADQVRTYMAGWAEPGELEATLAFKKSEASTVYNLFRQPKAFEVVFNDHPTTGSTLVLPSGSYIKSVGQEVDRENETLLNVTIKVSGKPEFTPSPSGV